MGKHDALTIKEADYIKRNFDKMTIGEMALALGRSYTTVQNFTSSENMHRFHKWTKEEDELLMRLWKDFSAEYIARRMKLDANCVYNRLKRLRKKGVLKS